MGQALIEGMLKNGFPLSQIAVCEIDPQKVRFIQKKFKIQAIPDFVSRSLSSDMVVLCVKPQSIKTVMSELGLLPSSPRLLISIAAGVRIQQIERHFKKNIPIIRVMPNTPAAIGLGMSALAVNRAVKKIHCQMAEQIFSSVGQTVFVHEKWMDAVTAVSGSGPAYIYLVIHALIEGGMALGLAPAVARQLACQTVIGAARMVQASLESPLDLMKKVMSPGGTTEAGIKVLDRFHFTKILEQAVQKAAERSKELSRFSD